MSKLLRFEFRKLFLRKSFYICLAVQAGYLILTALVQYLLYRTVGGEDIAGSPLFDELTKGYTGVDYLVSAAGQGATSLILAVFVTLFSCEDRTSDVLKNVYARGYNAMQVYFAEFIAVCAYAAIYCAFSWLCGFVIGTAVFGVGEGITAMCIFILFVQILVAIAFGGLFFMFSKIIPKQGGAIAMNIFAPTILSLIFTIIDIIVMLGNPGVETVKISLYSITGLFEAVSSNGVKAQEVAITMALAVAYAAIFVTAGAFVNRKKQA